MIPLLWSKKRNCTDFQPRNPSAFELIVKRLFGLAKRNLELFATDFSTGRYPVSAKSFWAFDDQRNLRNAFAWECLRPDLVSATGFSIRIVCFGTTYSVWTPFLFGYIASFS